MRDRILVEKAQSLYQSGIRKCDISKQLHVDTSSISRWCNQIIDNNCQFNTTQEVGRNKWYLYEKIGHAMFTPEYAKIILSILYWCEGAKYPSSNRIQFVSSDEKMQQSFIKLMRFAFASEIDESKFRVTLQLHSTHDIQRSISHWSKLLNISPSQFLKPHITLKTGSRYRLKYEGTCTLRYYDYRLLLRIMGTYKQFSNQIINLLV